MAIAKRKQRAPRAWSREDVKNLPELCKRPAFRNSGGKETSTHAGRRCSESDGTSGSGSDPSTASAEGRSDLARSIAAMVHFRGSEASKSLLKPIYGRRSRRRVDSWLPVGLVSALRLGLDRGTGKLPCLARATLICRSNCSINWTGAKKVACTQSSGGRISSHAAVTCRSIEYTRCRLTPVRRRELAQRFRRQAVDASQSRGFGL